MRYRKLPQHLRQKVLDYYEHRFQHRFFNEEQILYELSDGLREVNIIFSSLHCTYSKYSRTSLGTTVEIW